MSRNYGRFVISPLERGFGLTLGNALRRVMLSSLPGAAVTSIRVADVPHEFSAIPHIREDMTQLILNIKQLRPILHEVESARLRLDVQGGIVTAADIICPPEVEIKNPDLYLFAIDDDATRVEMEMTVETGRGYSPAEDRSRLPLGELPIDAIFCPIRRVSYDVERARVQQKTNYDRLLLEVWTDGTIEPEIAMSDAASVLMQHLGIIANVDPSMFGQKGEPAPAEEPAHPDFYDLPIEGLDLSVRVFNSLKRTGITTIGEVLEMLDKGEDAMLAIRNFGDKSLEELVVRLREKGYLSAEEGNAILPVDYSAE
ncbi:MAG: DNA-directed RNA polymerase subunit alpha [Anaerolineae bacterium]|nr:DNA-directed RNA polymerase subunit alpha [Anaerolineae bacterium]